MGGGGDLGLGRGARHGRGGLPLESHFNEPVSCLIKQITVSLCLEERRADLHTAAGHTLGG